MDDTLSPSGVEPHVTPDSPAHGSPPAGIRIRRASAEDVPGLRRICRDAILEMGPSGYGPEAVAAWAAFTEDAAAFERFVLGHRTWMAVTDGGEPAGFAGLGADGYVASLYVAPGQARRGVASALLSHLLATERAEGGRRFHAAASRVSLPLFQRFGFRVDAEEVVHREGVPLLRYRVVLEEASE